MMCMVLQAIAEWYIGSTNAYNITGVQHEISLYFCTLG